MSILKIAAGAQRRAPRSACVDRKSKSAPAGSRRCMMRAVELAMRACAPSRRPCPCGRFGSREPARLRCCNSRKRRIPNRKQEKSASGSRRAGSTSPTFSVGLGSIPTCRRFRSCPGYEVGGRIDALGAGVDARWAGTQRLRVDAFRRLCRRGLRSLGSGVRASRGHVGRGRSRDSGQLFHRLAALRRHGRAQAARPYSFTRWAGASALPQPRSPSISARLSSGLRLPQSTPKCARLASII